MGINLFFTIITLIVWLYLLSVCKRGKLTFYHFIIGSIGLFIICMAQIGYFQDYVIAMFVNLLEPIGNITGIFQSYPEVGAFSISNNETAMSFYIDIECSGIIEMLVFVCLILFFEVYSKKEKLLVSIVGVLCIISFNILRMLSVLVIIYYYGSEYYLLAHSIIGRIVFYVLTIILYFVVFTRKQINRQKVGKFSYESSILN